MFQKFSISIFKIEICVCAMGLGSGPLANRLRPTKDYN